MISKLERHLVKAHIQDTIQPDAANKDWFLFTAKMTFSFCFFERRKMMGIEKMRFHWLKSAALFIGLLWLFFFPASVQAEILIITNPNVSETNLSPKELEEIFLGKRAQWRDNSSIHPAVLKDPDGLKVFLKKFVRKSLSKWKMYWKRMVFTGRGLPPKSLKSEAELIKYVAATRGAVGYVTSEGLSADAEKKSVKIIKIGR